MKTSRPRLQKTSPPARQAKTRLPQPLEPPCQIFRHRDRGTHLGRVKGS